MSQFGDQQERRNVPAEIENRVLREVAEAADSMFAAYKQTDYMATLQSQDSLTLKLAEWKALKRGEGDPAHVAIYTWIERRRASPELAPVQLLRLGALKMSEEALETLMSLAMPREMSPALDAIVEQTRFYFRDRAWLERDFARAIPSDDALGALMHEMADVYACLAHMERLIVALTGREWSVAEEAIYITRANLNRPISP